MAHELIPPPSLVDLVKDDFQSDSTWKLWLNNLYEAVKEMNTGDPWMEHAYQIIEADYGVTVDLSYKNKDLTKFGRSDEVQVATKTTLMSNLTGVYTETYVTSNLITHYSSDAADTVDIVVEGHTVDGNGDFTFKTQTVTLAGTTKTALTTPLARCTRIYNADIGTPPANGTDLVGNVYVYQDVAAVAGVPASSVHCMIRAGEQQSEKCSTTLSSVDYWVVTTAYVDMLEKQDYNVDCTLEVRLKGGVFRPVFTMSAGRGGSDNHDIIPYLIIPPNSDVRLVALASNLDTTVSGGISGALVKTK